MFQSISTLTVVGFFVLLIHSLGILSAFAAILRTRTSQGATAWAIALVSFPYVALPLYWAFGSSKIQGYRYARQTEDKVLKHIREQILSGIDPERFYYAHQTPTLAALESMAKMPFTKNNSVDLLINGQQTFDEIFAGISRAKQYILFQFFIVKDDRLGQQAKQRLIDKAKEGVRVYFLYDEIGSHALPKNYTNELREAGIQVKRFGATDRKRHHLQINFRNHRKIVVIDGLEAFIGGLNVGTEYLGEDVKLSPWRDTHLRIQGPSVKGVQLAFVEDWYWVANNVPSLHWELTAAPEKDQPVLIFPSGPADSLETCGLMFIHSINSAKERIWISSPYFVPNESVLNALQLAALRGVDVRILLPNKADHFFVYWASFSYYENTIPHGIQLYRYNEGFIHQKIVLVDDDYASVGTANFDNRSFRLNFEITAIVENRQFAAEVESMLQADFSKSRPVDIKEYTDRSLGVHLLARSARLLAPIL